MDFKPFIEYCKKHIKSDEKGEAQTFLDHFFMALGYADGAALKQYNMSLRDLYRLLEQPGKNPIKDLHTILDKAVMEAYGFDDKKDILSQLLALNLLVAGKENKNEKVQPPGLPDWVKNKNDFISNDCVKFE